MKKILIIISSCLIFIGCKKDRYIFTMKSVQLNSYHKSQYPSQNISIKVVKADGSNTVLATTGSYPSIYTLPVTFAINPTIQTHLYKDKIAIQLWGDSSGFIASSTINMKEYKIMFPINMATKSDSVSFAVMGSWE